MKFENYIELLHSKFDLKLLKEILIYLHSLRFANCSIHDKIIYKIPRCYEVIDLLDIDQFQIYAGNEMCDREIQDVETWIYEGITLMKELNDILLLFYSNENVSSMNHIIQITSLQEKLEHIYFILKNLNDIALKQRECMNIMKEKRVNLKISGVPPYLLNLLELYTEQNKFQSISISELAMFLADIVQSNFPLVEKEQTSLNILLKASKNKEYHLMTKKHLSYRFFSFLSSISSLNSFASKKQLLEEIFERKVQMNNDDI